MENSVVLIQFGNAIFKNDNELANNLITYIPN
jgi:hypothetical protein